MKKYTANYTYTNPNFVIQNIVTDVTNTDLLPELYVIKNILQRGYPTILSKYLQVSIGEIHNLDNFQDRLLFVSPHVPKWNNYIKGANEQNYNPAKYFFEIIIPTEFQELPFLQSLIIPEIEIIEITGEHHQKYVSQKVDFYLPQAKLVIEIDGLQHEIDEVRKQADRDRDQYLLNNGITTIRITTKEIENKTYHEKIEKIHNHLYRYEKLLIFYKTAHEKIASNSLTYEEVRTKLLPTAIMRFQILLLELLTHGYLGLEEAWNFNILTHEDIPEFAELAINDLQIWLDKISQLKSKKNIIFPIHNIVITNDVTQFIHSTKAINIDFSLFKRYTNENTLSEDIIYIRTDYFDNVKEKNYFYVSTTEPINYSVTEQDKETLEFFLSNIFNKSKFLEGQFPIISNSLNRKDTIGLLPTGGGKSICYQLPCLLQPSINIVVCPIKSLMYDQHDKLAKLYISNVGYITSDLEPEERQDVESKIEQGKFLFIWLSPERFQIPTFRDKIAAIISKYSIAYAVIDEVHCLSEWGHDFRTSYLNLAKTIDKLSPRDENNEGKIKFIGLTATASVNVLKDIKIEFSRQKKQLEDENIKSLLNYSRKELQFEVINDSGSKLKKLLSLLQLLHDHDNFLNDDEKAGIVFTPNINGAYGCYPLSNTLNSTYKKKVSWFSGEVPKIDEYDKNGRKTGRKTGVLSKKEFVSHKRQVQKDFIENKYQLLVATKAFGMGIDKQNIYYTFHYGLPSSIEALYQEAGRAGRWDKSTKENSNKIGKCYVLYSPETYDPLKIERLFHIDTTFTEMKAICDDVGFEGNDIFKQLFLFIQGQNDVQNDFDTILKIISMYFVANSKVVLFWDDIYSNLQISNDMLQKAIYRLSLLGIVADWTTNFTDHYEVQFNNLESNHILNSISDYIAKYEPKTNVANEVLKIQKENTLEKALWYLLNWIFENVSYTRKQSLKTLSDWCSEYQDSDSFKQRIDSYFIFTESTFLLQHIAEHPTDYQKWFEVLKSDNQILPRLELEKLKDSISRFLESYRNSIGLNFVSGFVRLALGEYLDTDGKERFESTVSKLGIMFSMHQKKEILYLTKLLGMNLDEEQKTQLINSVIIYFPEQLEVFASYYGLDYLLNDEYREKLIMLKNITRKLYEQFTEI